MAKPSNRGFTLIELLIVLSIIALMMTFVPVMARHSLPSLKISENAAELADAARRARSIAIRDNLDSFLEIDLRERSYRVGQNGQPIRLDDGFQLRLRVAASEQLSEQRGRIRFFPDGGATGGRISLETDDYVTRVRIDWFDGSARVEEISRDELLQEE